jgi:hypothetical protein
MVSVHGSPELAGGVREKTVPQPMGTQPIPPESVTPYTTPPTTATGD